MSSVEDPTVKPGHTQRLNTKVRRSKTLLFSFPGQITRAIHPINSHKKHTRLLGGLSLIDPTRRHARLAHEWVSRAPYLAAAAMVVWVVAPTAADYFSPGGTPTNWGLPESFF